MTGSSPDGPTVEVRRTFGTPPELVFDAWLDPAGAGRWLFATPDGRMEVVEIDARVGGRFRIAERRGEELADHAGEYVEIERPRRLVFTFSAGAEGPPTRVEVEIAPSEGGCVLTLTHRLDPAWAAYVDRAREGWTAVLDNLVSSLG